MKVSNYIAVSLLVFGLILLGAAEVFYAPVEISPSEIDKSLLGDRVITEGTITDITDLEDITFLKIKQNPDLKVVKFTPDLDASKGDKVLIEGEVDLYQGDVELMVDEIKVK